MSYGQFMKTDSSPFFYACGNPYFCSQITRGSMNYKIKSPETALKAVVQLPSSKVSVTGH